MNFGKKRLPALLLAVLLALSACQPQTAPPQQTPPAETASPAQAEPAGTPPPAGTESPDPLADSERVRLWLEDIDAFSNGYRNNHIDLFYWRGEEFFDGQVERLRQRVPGLSDFEIVLELRKIINSMQDFHSTIDISVMEDYWNEAFPLTLTLLGDGLYVTNVLTGGPFDYSDTLCHRVAAVNGMDEAQLRERILPFVYGERYESARRSWYAGYFYPGVLRAAGLPEREDGTFVFTFEDENGNTYDRTVETLSAAERMNCAYLVEYPMLFARDTRTNWYTYLEDEGILYFAYNACRDEDNTLEAMFSEMRGILTGRDVRAVVVDLRNNWGGNNTLLSPFAAMLRDLREEYGQLYAVTGGNTFSSAVLNAVDLSQVEGAVLIGEPTGEYPDDLGNVRSFQLPNSGLNCNFSADIVIGGQVYHSLEGLPRLNFEDSSLPPDVYVENDIDSCRGMYDNVMNYVIANLQNP